MTMARNIEIKVRINDQQKSFVTTIASRLGEGPQRLHQVDTFFNTSEGRLKLREITGGTSELISYSREDVAEPRICNYLRFEVEQPIELKKMLEKSVGIRCVVEKDRDVYLIDQARIHVDQVQHLGQFLEIEVVLRSDQQEEAGAEIMESLLEQFQLDSTGFVDKAYADLIAQQLDTDHRSL
jgi:predicted adenylyl cyclase CyaB